MASSDAEAAAQTRSVGHSGLLLSGAKLYFIVLGLVQQVALSWVLQGAYGALRGALSPASITYNPLVAAGIQGMSRVVSQQRVQVASPGAVQAALLCQVVIGAVGGAGFFLFAPVLGSLLHSPHLVGSFRILAIAVFFYGIYAPLVGILNGRQRFGAQAGLDVLSATLRTLALIGGAYWFGRRGDVSAVEGACWGFALTSAAVTVLALILVRIKFSEFDGQAARRHLRYVGPLLGSQVVLNLLLQADTNMLRAFATRAGSAAGLGVEQADLLVGAYGAGQLFGFLPYQLLMGVTFILFPLLSGAQAREDRVAAASLVNGGVRIAALVTGLIVSISAGLSEGLLRIVFPPAFAEHGALSMSYLCVGLGLFALFGVFSAILNSIGRQWLSLQATALALALVMGLNWTFLRGAPFGDELLLRTALASSLGAALATAVAGFFVWRSTGALLTPRAGLRISMAAAVAIGVARSLPVNGKLLTLAEVVGVALTYVGLLLVMRELTARDLAQLRTVLGRRRSSG
jgi:stage V sporulation protein B